MGRFPERLDLLLSQCQSFACVEFNMAGDMLVHYLLHYSFMLECNHYMKNLEMILEYNIIIMMII